MNTVTLTTFDLLHNLPVIEDEIVDDETIILVRRYNDRRSVALVSTALLEGLGIDLDELEERDHEAKLLVR